jgi:hypothetical protein
MNFVYPGFLWALTLLAIPIIIHLFHFRRYRKVLFPNVRFLQNVQKETQSVKRVRNLLVLLARLLAITFLVLAFTQPYIPNKDASRASNVSALYIDNSFSMDLEGEQGPLIEEAKEKARRLVKAHPPSDRFIIHSTSNTSTSLLNHEDAIARIDEIEVGKTSKSWNTILPAIQGSLSGNGIENKHIYLFSDFQKTTIEDWSDHGLDSTSRLSLVPMSYNESSNITIDSAWLEDAVIHLNESITLKARLTNHSGSRVESMSLALSVNGERKSVSSVDIDPFSSKTMELGFTIAQGGWQDAQLSIEDAPITFDDSYYLSFNIKPSILVVLANGASSNRFLSALFKSDTYFNTQEFNQGNIDLSVIAEADLVVVNAFDDISTGLTSQLKNYVSGGGNVLIVPKVGASNNYLEVACKGLGIPAYGSKIEQEVSVGSIDLEHPLFERVFNKIPKNPDYPKVAKYYRLEGGNTSFYRLLTLENQDVFLANVKLNSGNIFQLASPLETEWNNFPEHGLFVPILLKMAMSRSIDFPLSYTISNSNLFRTLPNIKEQVNNLKLVHDEREWIPVVLSSPTSPLVDAGYEEIDAGNLELRAGDSTLQRIAFNYDRKESSHDYYSKDDIKGLVGNVAIDEVNNPTAYVKETISEIRFGQRFWKWCIILALIFIAIEILLLRFWPKQRQQQTSD